LIHIPVDIPTEQLEQLKAGKGWSTSLPVAAKATLDRRWVILTI
jgi:hypothetical protein